MSRPEIASLIRLQKFDHPAAKVAAGLRRAAEWRLQRDFEFARNCLKAARRNRLSIVNV